MNRSPVAVGLLLLVAAVMLVVIVGLVLRPWASADTDAMTKLNLAEEIPEEYQRTQGSYPGIPGYLYPSWQPNGLQAAKGYAEYIGHGCAFCHGLDGSGTATAGPVSGYGGDIVRSFVREGPGQMPSYSEDELTEDELQSIIDWIAELDPHPSAAPKIPHTLEDRLDCLLCHGTAGLKPFPADHVARAVESCVYCHA